MSNLRELLPLNRKLNDLLRRIDESAARIARPVSEKK
jgi:hypothetical protein